MDQKKYRKDGSLKSVSYAKWGYIFIVPFFLVYIVFTLVPQFLTVYNSFFETYRDGLTQVGPNFVGLDNYKELFTPDSTGTILVLKYAANTMIMLFVGALPQFAIALLLAIFFTSYRLNIKGQQFFKTVIYMPNLIMASAFSMLFFTLFSNVGPVTGEILGGVFALLRAVQCLLRRTRRPQNVMYRAHVVFLPIKRVPTRLPSSTS